jgi:high-affinity nickel-transport protein
MGIWRMWQLAKTGSYQPEQLDELLAQRGMMNRIFKGRYNRFINHSWQLYPVGVLFGLGFDTATEVGLLGLSATAAAQGSGSGSLPALAIIALPIIFAAGMSLMDTLDGVFMTKAYDWAFVTPVRKIYYNLTTTGLSIFVAFGVGTVEMLTLLGSQLGLRGEPWRSLAAIDINLAGRVIVAAFVVVWLASVVAYRVRRIDERYAALPADDGAAS